ncbi:MAG: efflux RND transporter periplasmic adaptor subunit [Desulfuromonas sp.]|nr:MAG: efflux RND transporter periplasmic adaptor subunit [Desulfuromonas sp.]
MSRKEIMLKIILPILIFLGGIAITFVLIVSRKAPERSERSYSGPLVEVVTVEASDRRVDVLGTGTAKPTQETEITPQVSGRVVYISSRMADGGFFKKGDLLFSIEKIDYELALERARSGLVQAELELMRNKSLAEIAQLEWQRVKRDKEETANPLTLYEPQLKAAEAQVASARSAVRQAEIELSRTQVRAPFNCFVRNEKVDLGQYVRAGTPVATVAGTDEVEIVVPLQLEELKWLSIPRLGQSGEQEGSVATVRIQVGAESHEWQGRIVRSYGEIDPLTRMTKVVVSVSDPFGKSARDDQSKELAPGMFVEVLLHGRQIEDIVAIPRSAVRDNDTVWVVDENNKLKVLPVTIVRRERTEVFVQSGLEPGSHLILTGIAAAADGMLLRPQMRERAE